MGCRLCDAKLFSKPMLDFSEIEPSEQTLNTTDHIIDMNYIQPNVRHDCLLNTWY